MGFARDSSPRRRSASVWAPARGLAYWLDIRSAVLAPSYSRHAAQTPPVFLRPVAETMGFEPMRAFKPYLVSSEALSAAQPRLQLAKHTTFSGVFLIF